MKFYTQYERPSKEECPQEVHLDQGMVETAGYVSTEKMVRRLIDAGERLVAFREAEFSAEEEVPEDYEPIGAISLLDALKIQKEVRERLREQARKAKADEVVKSPPSENKAGASAEAPAKEE